MSSTVVAIDGPAGAGKSTIAKALADRMDFTHVNTGSLYRAVALAARRSGADIEALDRKFLDSIVLEFRNGKLFLNGSEPGEELRSPECARDASVVAKQPAVREFLLPVQRKAAENEWIVMEGRDIGSVIFPDAGVKIFLTASVEVRAKRRLAQGEVPEGASFEDVCRDIEERDYRDSHRENAPLAVALGAEVVDCSELSIDETVEKIVSIVKQAGA